MILLEADCYYLWVEIRVIGIFSHLMYKAYLFARCTFCAVKCSDILTSCIFYSQMVQLRKLGTSTGDVVEENDLG